jgi:DNA-binding MarR family transcriptional regulator
MAVSANSSPHHERPEPAGPSGLGLLTVTRPELLVDGSDAEFRTLVHRLMSFTRCISAIRDGFGALAGITGVQYELMMWVARLQGTEGITVGEVSVAMRQSGAFTTIEVGKLVDKGLLDKNPDLKDRRRVRLRVTDQGRSVLESLAPVQRRINDVLFASIRPNELEELSGTFRDLLPDADHAANLMAFILKQGQLPADMSVR